ncbi:hypothetical protein GCM10011348_43860 [Marinobacterium nitratireducens]|uniref:DUF6455 domain-containing protein n=1 Tax=Marinobacterium nitratireducens TaxID=518897 RepID=A0A917ZQ47_9GAMM|nr:DUF6455 family protein [Marinobacterium nitratireducens]GGO88426.1 hypothetical protein GCM10011348_43860 [Marinobacterium nitratireducens]
MGIIRHIDDRLELMGLMLEATGADLARLSGQTLETEFRSAAYRCLGCRREAECERWLSQEHHEDPAPDFCPNSELMNRTRMT